MSHDFSVDLEQNSNQDIEKENASDEQKSKEEEDTLEGGGVESELAEERGKERDKGTAVRTEILLVVETENGCHLEKEDEGEEHHQEGNQLEKHLRHNHHCHSQILEHSHRVQHIQPQSEEGRTRGIDVGISFILEQDRRLKGPEDLRAVERRIYLVEEILHPLKSIGEQS